MIPRAPVLLGILLVAILWGLQPLLWRTKAPTQTSLYNTHQQEKR